MISHVKTITVSRSWNAWFKKRSYLGNRIKADKGDLRAYFLSLHGATEAAFRQIIFIGLRKNSVTYKEAKDWVFHNDKTPGKGKAKGDYIPLFNVLYGKYQSSWDSMLEPSPELSMHWDLWLGYSKIIRNHLAHSVRDYSEEWIETGVYVDKGLLYYVDANMAEILGHSPFIALSEFSPRLPVVRSGSDPYVVTGVKKGKPRPKISLKETKVMLKDLGYPVSVEA